jgi:hypothetical protein
MDFFSLLFFATTTTTTTTTIRTMIRRNAACASGVTVSASSNIMILKGGFGYFLVVLSLWLKVAIPLGSFSTSILFCDVVLDSLRFRSLLLLFVVILVVDLVLKKVVIDFLFDVFIEFSVDSFGFLRFVDVVDATLNEAKCFILSRTILIPLSSLAFNSNTRR